MAGAVRGIACGVAGDTAVRGAGMGVAEDWVAVLGIAAGAGAVFPAGGWRCSVSVRPSVERCSAGTPWLGGAAISRMVTGTIVVCVAAATCSREMPKFEGLRLLPPKRVAMALCRKMLSARSRGGALSRKARSWKWPQGTNTKALAPRPKVALTATRSPRNVRPRPAR